MNLQMDCTGLECRHSPNTPLDFTSKYTWRQERLAKAKDHTTPRWWESLYRGWVIRVGVSTDQIRNKTGPQLFRPERLPKSSEYYSTAFKCPRAWSVALLPHCAFLKLYNQWRNIKGRWTPVTGNLASSHFTTLIVKKVFLLSSLNLPSSGLKAC